MNKKIKYSILALCLFAPTALANTTLGTTEGGIHYKYSMSGTGRYTNRDGSTIVMMFGYVINDCTIVRRIPLGWTVNATLTAPDGTTVPVDTSLLNTGSMSNAISFAVRAPSLPNPEYLPAGYTLDVSVSVGGDIWVKPGYQGRDCSVNDGTSLSSYPLLPSQIPLTFTNTNTGAVYKISLPVTLKLPAGEEAKSVTIVHPNNISAIANSDGSYEQVLLETTGTANASVLITTSITPNEVARNAQILKTNGGNCTTMNVGDKCKLLLGPGTVVPGKTTSGSITINAQLR
ncbi:TPA: hypothetical protein ACP7R6_004747 [Escherichia coli]